MTGRLTPEQTERLAHTLAERRAALTRAIDAHFAQHAQTRHADLVGQVGDLEDHALAELLVDDELAGIQREIGELRAIQAAEDRLERGVCGICIDCGESIGFERLLAWPTATRCLPCQEAHEKTQPRPDHPTL
ncbi:MAG: TraR/DksA family transcriptional regulator [Halofilum sp. (in: g-proteobacteria)]